MENFVDFRVEGFYYGMVMTICIVMIMIIGYRGWELGACRIYLSIPRFQQDGIGIVEEGWKIQLELQYELHFDKLLER